MPPPRDRHEEDCSSNKQGAASCPAIPMTFLLFPKQPRTCAWPSAHSTITVGKEPARSSGAMEAASSTVVAICWRGRRSALPEWQREKGTAARRRPLLLAAMKIALLALVWPKTNIPRLYWNASASIPIGLYILTHHLPARNQLAVIRLPEPARALAAARGYLPVNALLVKPAAAGPSDAVCRHGPIIRINGRPRALAAMRDGRGRLLPRWHGCHRLTTSELFVLSSAPGSFDSRYIGPIAHGNVLGTAVPVWTP